MSFYKIRPRSGTAEQWTSANPVLAEKEIGYEVPESGIGSGILKMKMGDGVHTWNELPYGIEDYSEAIDTINENIDTLNSNLNNIDYGTYNIFIPATSYNGYVRLGYSFINKISKKNITINSIKTSGVAEELDKTAFTISKNDYGFILYTNNASIASNYSSNLFLVNITVS